MDWLRRNWPDLLIGVALVAVIAGIIATLVSGGSFFPVGNRAETPRTTQGITAGQTPGQSQSQSEPDGQQAGGQSQQSGPQSSSSLSSSVDAQEPPAVAVDPAGQESAEDPSAAQQTAEEPGAADTQAGDAQQSSVEALPPDGGAASAAAPPASSANSSVNSSVSSSASSSAAQPRSSSTPASQSAVASGPPPTASADEEAPYRVSVGAFGNAANAQRQLEAFQAAGYPAFIGTQGDLSIVLVGPYDTESEARSVAARIAGSNMGVSDPTVYRFEPDEQDSGTAGQPAGQQSAAGPSSAAASQTSQAPAQPAAPPQDQPAQAAAPGTRYLQVGAYGSRESSLPQRERLEGMGFVVSDRVEGDLVKLLIGPFDAGQLADAQARLRSEGIESFPR